MRRAGWRLSARLFAAAAASKLQFPPRVACATALAALALSCSPPLALADAAAPAAAHATAKWRVFTNRGRDLVAAGQLEEAEAFLRRALAEAASGFGEVDPHYAAALHNLADCLRLRGCHAEAAPLFARAVAVLRGGPNRAALGAALLHQAECLLAVGQSGASRCALAEALSEFEATLGRAHAQTLAAMAALAELALAQGATQDAAALALEAAQRCAREGDGSAALSARAAALCRRAGERDTAALLRRDALRRAEGLGDCAAHAAAAAALADSLRPLPDAAEAAEEEALLRTAVKMSAQALGQAHPVTAARRRRLADALLERGAADDDALGEATALLDAALAPLQRAAAASPRAALELAALRLARARALACRGRADAEELRAAGHALAHAGPGGAAAALRARLAQRLRETEDAGRQ